MEREKILKWLACLIVAILIVNLLANKFYWYYSIWYFDIIMHFLGGFWVGMLAFYVFTPSRLSLKYIARTLIFVFIIGIGWEVFEYYFINHIAQIDFNLQDTLADLFFDLFGGLCAILYLWKKQLK